MSEPLIPLAPMDDDDVSGAARNRQLMIVGGIAGVALAGFGAFYLLSGNSSGGNEAFVPLVHHVRTTASPTPSASASASAESVLTTYHGNVGDRDPFAIPAAILAAQSAAPAAPAGVPGAAGAPSAAGSVGAAGAPSAAGSVGLGATPAATAGLPPGPLTLPSQLPAGLPPGLLSGTPVALPTTHPTAGTAAAVPDQYLQLLAAHHAASGWTVDVRTAKGVAKDVKPGTKNVDGTLFYFQGDDETSGTPTFVFTVGESQGGNLSPNPKESPGKPAADKSTLILHNGVVDGGIYGE